MSEEKKWPEYLYVPDKCPCPRGEEAGCPNYKKCNLCTANHHGKGGKCACEKKAIEEGFAFEELGECYAKLWPAQ